MESESRTKMQEDVYGSGTEESHVMSERVQSLASSIYRELERMIEKYDEDVVKELMPLVVNILENLDSSVMDNQEHEVELELLRDDNEQLITQYEREKQLRRTVEQRLLEIEYSTEGDQRDLQSKVESLESIVRMLELKAKNSCEHAARLEDRENEMKKEYSLLHERYTELFKTHMDYIERSKLLYGSERHDSKSRTLHFPFMRSDSLLLTHADSNRTGRKFSDTNDIISPVSMESSDSNTSLRNELKLARTQCSEDDAFAKKMSSKTMIEKSQLTDSLDQNDQCTGTSVISDDFKMNEGDVMTPESDNIDGFSDSNYGLTKSEIKSEQRSSNTLYQELSFFDSDAIGEMDEGADVTGSYVHPADYASSDSENGHDHELKGADNFFGMGKEIENLISENSELLATKNALNIVKDDLITRLDELTCEQEILREELKSNCILREKMRSKIAELEDEITNLKESSIKNKENKPEEEEDIPMAQRKRFTRVEMARVLMERNQYKERLMELQDAVRWTEMMRASRSDSSLDTKRNKSSIWKFFSNLFNTNEKPARKPLPYVGIHYDSSTSNSTSALESMRRKRLGDRYRIMDLQDNSATSERVQQQKAKERLEQYKQVQAHVRKEDGRLQAYGWSLPTKTQSSNTKSNTLQTTSTVPVPVPVYCQPLLEKESEMKVWCAAGVNLSGGKASKPDQSDVVRVGSSQFFVSEPKTKESVLNEDSSDGTPCQDAESQNQSSLVWVCTSAHSNGNIVVIDANEPSEILDTFHVCSSNILCIASVTGVKESDYQVDEAFLKIGMIEPPPELPEKDVDTALSKNQEFSSKIGSIKYISSSANFDSDLSCEEAMQISDSMNLEEEKFAQNRLNEEKVEKMSSVLPTMWLGSQSGKVYVHSSVAQWWRCIHSVQLCDSALSIVHFRGRVFVALADGTLAIFHRSLDGQWDMANYHLIDLGQPHHSIRCATIVNNTIWCGYRNCIRVVNAQTLAIVDSFDAHPRKESQVRQMACFGNGVWITIRLDSTLRLYHATTRQHLQDIDIEPYVSKMLGTGKLGFSFVRITSLLIFCKRLWMGTGNGVIISVPLESSRKSISSEDTLKVPGGIIRVSSENDENGAALSTIPYCSMAQAQLSFHGHRDAVKFFVAVHGNFSRSAFDSSSKSDEPNQSASDNKEVTSMRVLSGGEGYIDFRIGDGEDRLPLPVKPDDEMSTAGSSKRDRSHLIVWQVTMPD